jgi:hypothetical protein
VTRRQPARSVRGIQPGGFPNRAAPRRNQPRPCDQSQACAHDGRRRDRDERARQRLGIYRATAGQHRTLNSVSLLISTDFAAVHESGDGTYSLSAGGTEVGQVSGHCYREPLGGADDRRGQLTHMYGPAARCKRASSTLADAVLHQCIRLLIGARCASEPSWISARIRSD